MRTNIRYRTETEGKGSFGFVRPDRPTEGGAMENAKKPRAIPAWAIAAALVLGLAASGALAWALEEAVAARISWVSWFKVHSR